MSNKVLLSIGKTKIEAQLLDTATARNIKDSLPFASKVQILGNQIIFDTPVMAELEDDARDVVKAGELAFMIEGDNIVIAFGKTPASQENEIRLATKANIWALAVTDVTLLKNVKTDDFVFIEVLQ